MKLGFSSLACPSWDLSKMVAKAGEYGFDGIELRGLQGELRLTDVAALAGNPGATRQMFGASDVELVCLACSVTFAARSQRERAKGREELKAYIELAAELECPFVRMFTGEIGRGETRESTISRVADELSGMASYAGERKVAVLIENGGDFSGSAELWYVCDAVSHPALRVCWNPCTALTELERPTISVPRLGNKIGMVHVCDGLFKPNGLLKSYELPGAGDVGWDRCIDLLKGIYYSDYLMFEWPRLWDASLAPPDQVLPQVRAFLKSRVEDKQAILTAYKGDKRAPKFKPAPTRAAARPG